MEQNNTPMVIRHARLSDLERLFELFALTDVGMTSLPKDKEVLKKRLSDNEKALDRTLPKAQRRYLFVLENSKTGELCGVSGIDAFIGQNQPFYDFVLSTQRHHSSTLGTQTQFSVLSLGSDYTGASELCSLFLSPHHRGGYNGKLLSKSRLLFMAAHQDEFADQVIAEMRGYFDKTGVSPYWQGFSRHFFGREFAEVDYLLGCGQRDFISQMVPRFPIYIDFLQDEVKANIGKVHPSTEGALALLTSEGFVFDGHIDVVDGGPKVVAKVGQLRAVTDSRRLNVEIATKADGGTPYLVSNGKFANFRATVVPLSDPDTLCLLPQVAQALALDQGDIAHVLPLDNK